MPNRELALTVKTKRSVMLSANEQAENLEPTILERVKLRPPFSFLKPVPWIGEMLALTIMLETGDIGRLGRV